jgi:hypothetical protein
MSTHATAPLALVPTLKMRRPVVYDRYADRIAALYE